MGSTRSAISSTASLGSVGDDISPTNPSDSNTESMWLTGGVDGGQNGRVASSVIVVEDDEDDQVTTKPEETAKEELEGMDVTSVCILCAGAKG
ncbi:hypothetical protein AX15_006938 [Amanita polypyramis BW_CC]|nr:hypothetical protein AX15_006938 [Amanita polypyramis BW_CC]